MKNYFFLILMVALASCGGSSDESTENESLNDTNEYADDSTNISQSESQAFDPSSIKTGVDFENTPFNGEEIMSIGWLDNRGQNVVILSHVYEESVDGLPSKWIYAAHYADASGQMELVREVTDFIKECDFDIILEFMDDPMITDINEDNIAEVTLVYKMACKSDVSEDEMKVIMYEGDHKYGLRGYNYIIFPEESQPDNFEPNYELAESEDAPDYYFSRGRYKNDDDFENAPDGFLNHARSAWLKHCFMKYN